VPQLEYYEKKVFDDQEFRMQMHMEHRQIPGELFNPHWHEHIEIHYILQGEADMERGQRCIHVKKGDCLISNSNVLHHGVCTHVPYSAYVLIFNMADISQELADKNYIFTTLIQDNRQIERFFVDIFREKDEMKPGYKQMIWAMLAELAVYLCRNHVEKTLPMRESLKHRKNMERLNSVLFYMENHYSQPISVAQLAEMACLSEDRFGHLFRESVGQAPLQYLNNIRLRKAMELLKTGEHSVTAVAEVVGFRDYNHFGRLFRKHYGCPPSRVELNTIPSTDENSGNV